MNGAKIKKIIIYILVLIILILIGYLIYYTLNYKEETKQTSNTTLKQDQKSCKINLTIDEFNSLEANSNKILCDGLNKITITNVSLDGETQKLQIYYQPNTNQGNIQLNGLQISNKISNLYQNKIIIQDNKIFISYLSNSITDISVYTKDGLKIYNLKEELEKNNIKDPSFTQLATTDQSINQTLDYKHIDQKSVTINPGIITFNSSTKKTCQTGMINGSKYQITYKGNTFTAPTYTGPSSCS